MLGSGQMKDKTHASFSGR